MPLVSIALCVANSGKYLNSCLNSLLNQSFSDFEIIIVVESSSDNTYQIIKSFNDERIRFFINEKWLGLTKSRNKSLRYASGKYIFFTDGDCVTTKNWLEEGLKTLKSLGCIGVEGAVYYVSPDYHPTFSDHVMQNREGKNFLTANMGYETRILRDVGGFDEKYTYHEDRDIALRIANRGTIRFNPNMVVYHQRIKLNPMKYLNSAGSSKNRVYLYKKYGDKVYLFWPIFNPGNLIKIIFPPAVFLSLFFMKFRNKEDYMLLPFSYLFAFKERILFWRECARERVFLI